MRAPQKRWLLLAALIAALLFAFLMLSRQPRSTNSAVAITFVGYTNPPGNPSRFALFSISNQAPYAVRWRGSWVEIEGKPEHKAETISPNLPGFKRQPVLKAGGSLAMAIGEPLLNLRADAGGLECCMCPTIGGSGGSIFQIAIICRLVLDPSYSWTLGESLTQPTLSLSPPLGSANECTVSLC
jgi:hypothetical protein